MVARMAPAVWSKTNIVFAAVVTACVLLTGCASTPSSPGSSGPVPGSEATPDATDATETVDMADPASCLIGTWQQDMKVFTEDAIKEIVKLGGSSDAKVKWGGGAFLRFDVNDMFYVWTEDSTFEWWGDGFRDRTVTNGNAFGDYNVDAGTIHWSNYSTLNLDVATYENDARVDDASVGDMGNFSNPSSFTCTGSTLEIMVGDAQLTMPRVYDRIDSKSAKY